VKSLHNGRFRLVGPAGKGMRLNLGLTAVLTTGNATILVCETPSMCGDLGFYRTFGLDPEMFQLVVVKANTSFRENYESLAASIHMADTPGAASADLTALPYKKLPKTLYPFSDKN
jgi:microcystin degradation protein MlrC